MQTHKCAHNMHSSLILIVGFSHLLTLFACQLAINWFSFLNCGIVSQCTHTLRFNFFPFPNNSFKHKANLQIFKCFFLGLSVQSKLDVLNVLECNDNF